MQDIDEKLRLLQPVLGTVKSMKLRMLYHFEDDARGKREIETRIDLLISKLVKTKIEDEVILPPPARNKCAGDIHIGDVRYLNKTIAPFALKLKDLNRHLGIFGSTGSGKTTLAKHLIAQLHKRGIPFLIIDWEKSYRSLKKKYPDVDVFTVGKDINPLHLNPLELPPGISKDEYAKSLIAILAEDYLSGAGSDTMLLRYIKMAYQENAKPCFEDLKEIVIREISQDIRRKKGGRSGLWKETVQRIIEHLALGASGNVLSARESFPIPDLFNINVVLEFGNIQSPRDRKFFIHLILNWMFLWLQHHGIESEHLNQCIIMEEFHNISMKGAEDNLVSLMFRQVRKYGVGLMAIDQTPSAIPNAIYANMNTKISFTLATAQDIGSMSKAMNMDARRARFLSMLSTGEAIANVRQRHPDPFLIKVPFTHDDDKVLDSELQAVRFENSQDSDNSRPIQAPPDIWGSSQTAQEIDTSPPRVSTNPPMTPMEKVMLSNIAEKPMDSIQDRTKALGLHPSDMVKIQESLTEKGYIKTAYVDRKKLLDLTDEGRKACKRAGIIVPKRDSRGGIEHHYWIDRTRQFLRKLEFQPVLEHQDIDIQVPDYKVAIEMETGKSNIAGNLVKLEKSRILAKFMLATNKAAEFKIKHRALDFPGIRAMHVSDFLKLTRNQILNPQSTVHLSHSTPENEVVVST
jgi:DNA-binding MarR family transcriptional regulator/energy-coupling factor transporter ATP-binding protein EcfA2